MSCQRFDACTRQAFWHEHGYLCIYCGRVLDRLTDVQLDHVVPIRLAEQSHEVERQELLARLLVPADFDLMGHENLVPCCAGCNGQKGSRTGLAVNPIVLQKAGELAERVRRRAHGLRQRIVEIRNGVGVTVPFSYAFGDRKIRGAISQASLQQLEDVALCIGGLDSLPLSGHDDPAMRLRQVRTIAEWRAAIKEGYRPGNTMELKMSSYVRAPSAVLDLLENARVPAANFLSEEFFVVGKLDRISGKLIEWSISPEIRDLWIERTFEDASLGLILSIGKGAVLASMEEGVLDFEVSGFAYRLRELIRADFDGDGVEEILCDLYERAKDGTHGCNGLCLLRKNNKMMLATPEWLTY